TSGRPIGIGLSLEGLPHYWLANAFRKVRPMIEPASEEFNAFLRDALKGPVEVSQQPHSARIANSSNSLRVDSRTGAPTDAARPAPHSHSAPGTLNAGADSWPDCAPTA